MLTPPQPPTSQTDVVIVYRTPLFAQGIASLLRAEGIGGVLGVHAGEPSIAERIERLHPLVVILEAKHDDARMLLPPILDAIPWVMRVGLDGTAMEIYRRTHLNADSAFIRLIARIARRVGRAQAGGTT